MGYYERCKKKKLKLELGYFAPRNCWKKKYKSQKPYYFKHPNSKEGYEKALQDFFLLKAKVDEERPHARDYAKWTQHFKRCIDWYDANGIPESEEDISEVIAQFVFDLEEHQKDYDLQPPHHWLPSNWDQDQLLLKQFAFVHPIFMESMPEIWADRLRTYELSQSSSNQQQIGYWMDFYFELLEEKVKAAQRSPRTLSSAKQHLSVFRNWIWEKNHITAIDAQKWLDFFRYLLNRDDISTSSKSDYRNSARTWVKWAHRQDACELKTLPSNIDDRSLTFIHVEENEADPFQIDYIWTPDEFRSALSLLDDHWRCWLILMLNCGFTQTDINDIRHPQLALDEGRLIHKRKKTRRCPNAPKVNYKLWPETIAAIQRVKSSHPTFAFLSHRGKRLIEASHNKMSRLWQDKRKIEGIPQKPLKGLRKTGSTTIKQNTQYGWVRTLYLGQVGEIADKNYDAKDGRRYAPLDEALDWMREIFFPGVNKDYNEKADDNKVELTPEMMRVLSEAGLL